MQSSRYRVPSTTSGVDSISRFNGSAAVRCSFVNTTSMVRSPVASSYSAPVAWIPKPANHTLVSNVAEVVAAAPAPALPGWPVEPATDTSGTAVAGIPTLSVDASAPSPSSSPPNWRATRIAAINTMTAPTAYSAAREVRRGVPDRAGAGRSATVGDATPLAAVAAVTGSTSAASRSAMPSSNGRSTNETRCTPARSYCSPTEIGAVSITTGTMRSESSAATEISRSTLLEAMAAGETTSRTTSDARMAAATELRQRSLPRMSSVSIQTS